MTMDVKPRLPTWRPHRALLWEAMEHDKALKRVKDLLPGLVKHGIFVKAGNAGGTLVRYITDEYGKRKRVVEVNQPFLVSERFPRLCLTKYGEARYRPFGSVAKVLTERQRKKLSTEQLTALWEMGTMHFARHDTTNGAGTHLA